MGWSFRKRIKIAPGIHMNIGKNGPSFSVGGKGASVSFGEKGTYLNTSIPGTGLRNRQKIDGNTTEEFNQSTDNKMSDYSGCLKFILLFFVGLILLFVGLFIFSYNFFIGIFVCIVTVAATLFLFVKQETAPDPDSEEPEVIYNPVLGLDNKEFEDIRQSVMPFVELINKIPDSHTLANKILKDIMLLTNEIYGHKIESEEKEIVGVFLLFAIHNEKQIDFYNYEQEITQTPSFKELTTKLCEEKGSVFPLDVQLTDISSIAMFRYLSNLLNYCVVLSKSYPCVDERKDFCFKELIRLYSENVKDFVNETDKELEIDRSFEDVARLFVSTHIVSSSLLISSIPMGYQRRGRIMEQLELLGIIGDYKGSTSPRDLYVQDENILECYLSEIKNISQYFAEKNIESNRKKKRRDADECSNSISFKNLDKLIGLESVKQEVKNLTNFIVIKQKREAQGFKSSPISYHCVFTGNPGTGKTTVARIVASIYKKLGILKKGHLVETDRSGLVAEYVGQTAVKTNKIIDSALDGVLFIDEAYSLASGGEHDFGREAISTLLKRMEDDRDRLIVILAGYTDDMKNFIDTNPGLQSRFNRYIDFPDYSEEELFQIFKNNCKKYDYHINPEAESKLKEYLYIAVKQKDKNFGNARFVRNLFEKTIEKQASRLSRDSDITDDELTEILSEDIPDVSSN